MTLSHLPLWTLDELSAQVSRSLAVDYPVQANGRVREVPDSRTIRYYTTLGLREFPLGLVIGIEALERFVRREPLRRVHECRFAVLAQESEPFDPRLW